jgi:hypothetical protein
MKIIHQLWNEIKEDLDEEEVHGPYFFKLFKCPEDP